MFDIANFIGLHTFLDFFLDSRHMHLYLMTNSANQKTSQYHEDEQPCAQGQHQNTNRNSVLCKHTVLYILHTK